MSYSITAILKGHPVFLLIRSNFYSVAEIYLVRMLLPNFHDKLFIKVDVELGTI